MKEALFSEKIHETKEPQLGRQGSAPPPHPNTLKKQEGLDKPERQKSLEEQAQEEPPKDKTAVKARYKGDREAGTGAGAEENQVEEQAGAIRKWQAGIRKFPVDQSTRSERSQERTAGGQDQPHTGPPLPNHSTQIGSPSPPAAGPSGTRTLDPPIKGDSVIYQASGGRRE